MKRFLVFFVLLLCAAGHTIPEHLTEMCVATANNTLMTAAGLEYEINNDILIPGEKYTAVFYTCGTYDRRDDEIIDFNIYDLEIIELEKMDKFIKALVSFQGF